MYRKKYPPVRYVFYPLYRTLRKRVRLPRLIAYVMVWLISGFAHALVMMLFGHPGPGLVFAGIFLALGLAGAAAHRKKYEQRAGPEGR